MNRGTMKMTGQFIRRLSSRVKMGEDIPRYYVPNGPKEDQIKYRTHNTAFYALKLDSKFRLSNLPMYQNPLVNFVIGSKRLSIAFGVIGCVFAYLMDRTGLIYTEFCQLTAIFSVIPAPIVQFLFNPYVSRVWRVYDTTKPQNIENLTKNETLIFEKLNWSGFQTYNELITVDSLEVPTGKEDYRGRFGYVNLISTDKATGSVKYFFINEGFSNVKMDRILALAERNCKLENPSGRDFFDK